MDNVSSAHEYRLRNLEAEALKVGSTLADMHTAQTTAFANIDSLGDALGVMGERSVADRLRYIEETVDDHTATLASHTATLANHGAKLDQIIELLRQR